MKHLQFHTVHRDQALWHSDPLFESFMRHLIDNTKPCRFVETGTHLGWTAGWVAENYPSLPIHTVEIKDSNHALAAENLAPYPLVTLVKGDSRDFIRRQCEELRSSDGIPLFWLDAHWEETPPLRDECQHVAALDRYICVIDDFELENPHWEGDAFWYPDRTYKYNNIAYVADIMGHKHWRPDYDPKPGYKGYALFLKNVDYTPPSTMRGEDEH